MEGDEGMYTCSVVILETSASDSVMLGDLTGKLLLILYWMCCWSLITVQVLSKLSFL